MRGQGLLLTIPTLSMAVVGFAMFGPGAVRPFEGAQIWGGPPATGGPFSFRVAVIQRFRGIDSTFDAGLLTVEIATAGRGQASATCRTRQDGTCELDVPWPPSSGDPSGGPAIGGPVHATVRRARDGALLAEGDLWIDDAKWGNLPGHPARIQGHAEGDLGVKVYAHRGIFAAPFRDPLDIRVTGDARADAAAVSGAHITVHAEGADLDATAVETNDRGEASVDLAPQTHSVEVSIVAEREGRRGSWDGILPVIPGAMWLDPKALQEAHKVRVLAPVPREVAYVTLSSATARVWSTVVPLSTDARGFAAGEVDLPEGVRGGLLARGATDSPSARARAQQTWLTISSDPRGTGAGTVGFPIPTPADDEPLGERPFRDQLLLDGTIAAEARNAAERARARILSAVVLGGAAVLEGTLLAERSRGGGRAALGRVVLAIATITVAFAALGIVAMWKTG